MRVCVRQFYHVVQWWRVKKAADLSDDSEHKETEVCLTLQEMRVEREVPDQTRIGEVVISGTPQETEVFFKDYNCI